MQIFVLPKRAGKTYLSSIPFRMPKWLFLMAVLFAGFFVSTAKAQYSNVPVTGFNADIVADGTTNPDATTTTNAGADGAGWVFVTSSFHPSATAAACSAIAFPAPTITSTNATNSTGITYTLQP